jgi:hypothetical protein
MFKELSANYTKVANKVVDMAVKVIPGGDTVGEALKSNPDAASILPWAITAITIGSWGAAIVMTAVGRVKGTDTTVSDASSDTETL